MLSIIFEYNWYKLNEVAKFSENSYTYLLEVWGFSWNSLNHEITEIVNSHIVHDTPSYMAGRKISLWGAIIWATEEEMLEELNKLNNAFSIPRFARNLKDWYSKLFFQREWWKRFYINAKVDKLPRFDKTLKEHRKRGFFIELYCEDPFFYEDEEQNINIADEDWFKLSVNLPKPLINAKAKIFQMTWNTSVAPYFKLTWKFQSIRIDNIQTGDFLLLDKINTTESDFLEIDVAAGTIYKNWDYSIDWDVTNYITSESTWIFLEPWENKLRISYSGNDSNGEPDFQIKYKNTFNNIEL